MKKRTSSRGIIIEGDYIYTMFRRKKMEDGKLKEYYVIPGGGVEENESLEEALKRELKEEMSIEVDIIEYLGFNEDNDSIAHFYKCNIKSGNIELGGEEKEKCSEDNYYEIRKIKKEKLDSIDIFPRYMIIKAFEKVQN